MSLEPRIEAIRQEYGLEASDFWQIKQNGQWVCKHAALEIVAVKAGIEFDLPVIIEHDAVGRVTSMIVRGSLPPAYDKAKGRSEWATGETNPSNYSVVGKQPSYPWAMAEKRAKDRVILKLVGIHGLVYSEDEMADTPVQITETRAQAPTETTPKPLTVAERKALWSVMMDDLKAEAPKGWRKMAAYITDAETQRMIDTLGSFKEQFLTEARAIVQIAKDVENELGEPVGGLKTTPYNFDQLSSTSTVGDMLDATENAE